MSIAFSDFIVSRLIIGGRDVADSAAGWIQFICDSDVDGEEHFLCGEVCAAVLLYDRGGNWDYYGVSADCVVFCAVDDGWVGTVNSTNCLD